MTIIIKDMDLKGFRMLLEWYSKIDDEAKKEFILRLPSVIQIISNEKTITQDGSSKC